jgi:hypothetical protein
VNPNYVIRQKIVDENHQIEAARRLEGGKEQSLRPALNQAI